MSVESHQANIAAVVDLIASRIKQDQRTVIAIAGPPASGKTTLAEAVVERLNAGSSSSDERPASLFPMDGYHLSNPELDSLGLRDRKGSCETFDASGFCDALERLCVLGTAHDLPGFDRDNDCVVPGAIRVGAHARIIVAEGNYLLLDRFPWREAQSHYTARVFVKAPLAVLSMRLQERWRAQGLTARQAEARVQLNDLPNATLVLKDSTEADLVLEHLVHDGLEGVPASS